MMMNQKKMANLTQTSHKSHANARNVPSSDLSETFRSIQLHSIPLHYLDEILCPASGSAPAVCGGRSAAVDRARHGRRRGGSRGDANARVPTTRANEGTRARERDEDEDESRREDEEESRREDEEETTSEKTDGCHA